MRELDIHGVFRCLLFILCIVGDLRKEEEDGKGATFNARFNHALFVGKDNSTSVAVLEPTSPFLTHTHVVEAPITDEGLEREQRRRRQNGLKKRLDGGGGLCGGGVHQADNKQWRRSSNLFASGKGNREDIRQHHLTPRASLLTVVAGAVLVGCVHLHLLLQDRVQSQRRVGHVEELGHHHGEVPEGIGALLHLAARAAEGGGLLENPKQLRLSDSADRYRMGQARSLTVLMMVVR